MGEVSATAPGDVRWGAPADGLRLGIAAGSPTVALHLENVGETPLEVMSHVLAGEVHLDWYRLTVVTRDGERREIVLRDARDRSAPIRVGLAPGESLHHEVDVAAWAARGVNGGRPLPAGAAQVAAEYRVDPGLGAWTGRLEAGPVALTVP